MSGANINDSTVVPSWNGGNSGSGEDNSNSSETGSSPKPQMEQQKKQFCSAPMQCLMADKEVDEFQNDTIKVICSNADCKEGQFMHRHCFTVWEDSILAYLRSAGKARSWSERQQRQNMWTKKGYDLAYQACECRCGKGHLRKDTGYIPNKGEKTSKRRRRSGNGKLPPSKPTSVSSDLNATGLSADAQVDDDFFDESVGGGLPPRCLSLGSATMKKAYGQRGFAQAGRMRKNLSGGGSFADDDSSASSGSIFSRRNSLSQSLLDKSLPRWKINGYHIKMEDDCPQGNDETRCFVLTSLGDHKLREVECVMCRRGLTIYDRYPLVDGAFFLSPLNHSKVGVPVHWENNPRYLLALCVCCLERSDQLQCSLCRKSGWFHGECLQLGTMYTYDVLSAFVCCPPQCKYCGCFMVGDWRSTDTNRSFSNASTEVVCPQCGHKDYHFLKSIDSLRMAVRA